MVLIDCRCPDPGNQLSPEEIKLGIQCISTKKNDQFYNSQIETKEYKNERKATGIY